MIVASCYHSHYLFSPHAYPMDLTLNVLTVHFASPLACLLFMKRCLLDMQVQSVSLVFMLHAGSVHHLQPRRRLLQATLLHHCIRLLPIHHVSAARLTFPAFHQCPIQYLHPGLLYYCHRHVHTQWYALDCSNHDSVDVKSHFPLYDRDDASETQIALACPSEQNTLLLELLVWHS